MLSLACKRNARTHNDHGKQNMQKREIKMRRFRPNQSRETKECQTQKHHTTDLNSSREAVQILSDHTSGSQHYSDTISGQPVIESLFTCARGSTSMRAVQQGNKRNGHRSDRTIPFKWKRPLTGKTAVLQLSLAKEPVWTWLRGSGTVL
jgi:hypothetical protein